jgi:predicted CXXCH cytochrome family protein
MLVAVGGWLLWFTNRHREWTSADERQQEAHIPTAISSPFENTRADVRYVGIRTCVECHPEQHATYQATAHSRSMSAVDPAREPADAVFDHASSGRRYRVYRQDGKLRHRESLILSAGDELQLCDYPLSHLVGSGRFTRSYLVSDAEFLVESPITWYAALGKWAMSPGFDRPEHRSFHRPIEQDCLYCHTGSITPIGNSTQRFRIDEMEIGCERCHGPGSLHVARWTGSSDKLGVDADFTIVNPKRLSRELVEAICHQCHLTGEIQIAVRGRRPSDFRPGLRWQDFAIDYLFDDQAPGMTVVGHVSQMHQSRCYQFSKSLTCTSCHDPHVPIESAERVAHYRAICLNCHAEPSCKVPEPERSVRNGNDCVACHMPQSETDIQHVAFTHHRIGIHQPVTATAPPDAAVFRRLEPALDISHLSEDERRRGLGLAYMQFHRNQGETSASAPYLNEARPIIEDVVARGMMDAALAMAQAEMFASSGSIGAAEQWANKTLSSTDLSSAERTGALRLLASSALQQNHIEEARKHLEQLVELCRDPRDWLLLGLVYQRQKKLDEATAAFERVLSIDPAQPETYSLLAPLYQAQGRPERAEWCRVQASSILNTREKR